MRQPRAGQRRDHAGGPRKPEPPNTVTMPLSRDPLPAIGVVPAGQGVRPPAQSERSRPGPVINARAVYRRERARAARADWHRRKTAGRSKPSIRALRSPSWNRTEPCPSTSRSRIRLSPNAGARPIPFNRADGGRQRVAYLERPSPTGISSGDGPFTKRCNAWLEARDRLRAGLADPFLHGRHGDGRHAVRSRPGRRGHHALVHLRVDRQRGRAARRRAGLRRHPARHAEHRRDADRGRHHAADAGDLRRPLRRRRLRHGRDHGDRGAARPVRPGGRGAGHRGRPTTAGRSAASAISAR